MKPKSSEKNNLSRRTFLKCTGTIIFALGSGCYLESGRRSKGNGLKMAVSDGYLLVDIGKCQGCISCMLACSLVHEGVQNPSLSRIQILQNSFEKFPDDLTIEQCRQCEKPACVEPALKMPLRPISNLAMCAWWIRKNAPAAAVVLKPAPIPQQG